MTAAVIPCSTLTAVALAVDGQKDRPLVFLFILRPPARQQGTRRQRVNVQKEKRRREEVQQRHRLVPVRSLSPRGRGSFLPLTMDGIKKGGVPEPQRVPGGEGDMLQT